MDFASRFLGGYGQGRADKQQADALAKQEKINALLGAGYADASQREQSLAAVAPLDFNAAVQGEQAYASRDERVNKGRANLSRTYLAMPAEGRERFRQQFGQDFQRLGLDPADPNFDQIATGYAQLGTGDQRVQSSKIGADGNIYNIMADGQIVNTGVQADRQAWFRDNPGQDPYIVGKGGDVRVVGQSAPQQAPQQRPASGSPVMDNIMATANAMIKSGVPEAQVDAFVMQASQASPSVQVSQPGMTPDSVPQAPASQPSAPTLDRAPINNYGGGPVNSLRRPSAAEDAAASERAKLGVQQEFAPRQAELDAQREAAITSARTGATNQAERDAVQRTNNTAFAQYTAARDTLLDELASTSTGPLAGRLLAVTENQQIAEGAQARMAPILKGLFRTAGEGTFTDKDQDLLMRMVPTRTDLPGAVKAKIAGIDAIVEAKLQQSGGQSAQEDPPPVPGARKAPDGNWYVQQNGQTFKVEQ